MDQPAVTKRRVTLVSYDPPVTAVDYVRPDFLDAYLATARGQWAEVHVADEPDAGPGGYHGATYVPAELDHPLAGKFFPATTPEQETT